MIMLFWILKWGAVAFGAWFLWGLRNWMRAPWATYVDHTKLKNGETLMKVRRLSAWPPWNAYTETWYAPDFTSWVEWHREHDGTTGTCSQDKYLCGMLRAAEARKRETDEIIEDGKSHERPR